MVALKKLFQQSDQNQSRPSSGLGIDDVSADGPYFETTPGHLEPNRLSAVPSSPGLPSPGFKTSHAVDVSHHFDQIDKQFEDLHHHMGGERPTSSQSQLPPSVPTSVGVPRYSNSRHIDLMDAIFTTDRNQATSPSTVSPPTSPYNEDVAERNMTRFLRIQYRKGFASSRILSALYQEDVADRNIAKYGGQSRSTSALSSRSSPPAPGRRRRGLSPMGSDGKRRDSRTLNLTKGSWMSEGDLRNRSTDRDSGSSRASHASTLIRLQRSAPTLSPEETDSPAGENLAAVQRLGVPPAYKQGKRWSNTPLPDSPTLPFPISDSRNSSSGTGTPKELQAPTTTARSSSLGPRSLSPPPSSGPGSKKNVRDLSINTQLASQGRPKISHRAISPPTPSNYEMKRAPSIAEVMNSPLPAPSPSPSGQPSPRFKVSEMMDLFKQAYISTQTMSSHPTYETLQDAIVREINSHDAFKSVPVPVSGPPFTPSDQENFPRGTDLNRSASAGQLSKTIRKSSFRKHKRNSESRQSFSSVQSKGFLRTGGRRHTDAPLPSPGLLAELQQSGQSNPTADNLTYMDILRANSVRSTGSQNGSRQGIHSNSATDVPPNLSTAPRSTPDSRPITPGTIYCMQAHSDSSREEAYEESDDDIIHLPSVGAPPPRVQIEGVDENNVRYVIDSATASDAHKLMSWPQRVRRANSPQPSTRESSLSPLARARIQLRGARSVETY